MVMRKYKYYTIYQITNLVNGKIYIGAHQTDDLDDGYMGSGRRLKDAIKKYGWNQFKKEYIHTDLADMRMMYVREKEIVNEDFILRKDTYNIQLGGTGMSQTPKDLVAARKKMSDVQTANWKDPEYRKKMLDCMRNSKKVRKPMAESTKENLRKKNKGHAVSAETREKISRGLTGKKLSAEHIARLKEGHKNRKPADDATRKLLSEKSKISWEDPKYRETVVNKVRVAMSKPETRKKMSESQKKRRERCPVSEETKKKLSEMAKKREERNRKSK